MPDPDRARSGGLWIGRSRSLSASHSRALSLPDPPSPTSSATTSGSCPVQREMIRRRLDTSGLWIGSNLIRRSESVFARLTSCAVRSASIPKVTEFVPTLAHLVSVEPQDERCVAQQSNRLGEEGLLRAVTIVESSRDESSELQVWQLVPADGDDVRLTEQDVGGLVNGVIQHQGVHRGPAAHRELLLDRGVPLQLGNGHQAQERNHELIERLDLAVRKDRRPAGVDADGEVVSDQAEDVRPDPLRRVAISDRLIVGDEHQNVDAAVLHPHAVQERPEQVPDMQRPGWAIPAEHAKALGRGVDFGLDRVAASLRDCERLVVRIGCHCCPPENECHQEDTAEKYRRDPP